MAAESAEAVERPSWSRRVLAWLRLPLDDLLGGLDRALGVASPAPDDDHTSPDRRSGFVALVLVFLGLGVGWWIYVPLHELLHAFGCLATGGEVTRLEIQAIYGGALLAEIFPFVVAGGDYAGRLVGFDTHGNDWIYLATDLAPFVLCWFPGVWALRRAARRGGRWTAVAFGFWLPWALSPFLSATGDAFEIGTLAVTQLPPWDAQANALRSDDLLLWVEQAGAGAPWLGAGLAACIGLVWAFATYALGGRIAHALGQPPLSLS
ncbi:MAG: hypothetical protein AAGN46_12895 [Acidobacteriota bacterium]